VSYLLDTTVIIGLSNDHELLTRQIRHHPVSALYVSALVMHELYFGAYGGDRTNQSLANIERLRFPVLDFNDDDARRAAEIRARLRRLGTPIGPYDVLIAGQALSRGLTLITRNVGEFSRIEELAVENWEA